MSNSKNSISSKSSSSKGNKYAVLSEEALNGVRYGDLWDEGMDMGLIGEDREFKVEYYHMVYRKTLIWYLEQYRRASDREEKKALAQKFEANLVKECKKKDLWEEGLDNGMIFEEFPSEGFHYTSYKLEDLEKHSVRYKALKDEEKKEDYAYVFEKTLKTKNEVPKRNREKKNNSEIPIQRPSLPQKEGPSFAKVVSRQENQNAKPVQALSRVGEVLTQVSPLAACWEKCIEHGFIHPKNQYHPAIVSFITLSELESLLKEWSGLPKPEQMELAIQFKGEIDHYNENIPFPEQGFKVTKPYRKIWSEAARLDIIPDDVNYHPSYVEWLPSENLAAYIQTIRSLGSCESYGEIHKAVCKGIEGFIEEADKVIRLRGKYFEMKREDLIKEANTNKPSSRKPTYADCTTCSAKLDHNDLALALASWEVLKEDREEARGRYLRWHAYRKSLHLQCPKD